MCELLVYAADDKSPRSYARGDVVTICPDGWEWGRKEGPPTFRVIRVPGASAQECEPLLGRDFPEGMEPTLCHRRAFRLDLDALGDTATLAEVMAAKVRKAPAVDENVLG